jgi:hypothetical protein
MAVIAIGACGADEGDAGGDVSIAELRSHLSRPATFFTSRI